MTQNKSEITKSITWEDETIPRSVQFDDTYYSKADGLAETRHVFIASNNLPTRWKTMPTCAIGELGFGTGLNFLATIIDWQEQAKHTDRLSFTSFEQYPINHKQMSKALSRWTQITSQADKLVEAWKNTNVQTCDTVKINFTPQIELTVHIGDANNLLPKLNLEIDAWYLDGFSPAKNPELWNEALMQAVGNATKPKGTFATYTAASFIRKNLANSGFTVERIKGHAGKRHMTIGKKA